MHVRAGHSFMSFTGIDKSQTSSKSYIIITTGSFKPAYLLFIYLFLVRVY